jgi:hypothetical protein
VFQDLGLPEVRRPIFDYKNKVTNSMIISYIFANTSHKGSTEP